jgi:MFS transporter, SP family, sugar:H+ symporter
MSNGGDTKAQHVSSNYPTNSGGADLDADGNVKQTIRVYLICIFVAFGGFLFGYDCVIGGPMIDIPKFRLDFGTPQKDGQLGFTTNTRGGFVAVMSLGTFCGALCASQFADRLGRKKGLLATCLVFTVGIIFQIAASAIGVLMLGRYIAGFGVGLVSVMVPLYQAECIPAKRRGTIVSCYQLAITIGLLIGQIVLFFTQSKPSKASYKIPIGLQFAWSAILAIGMLYFPETPRYLIKVGQWDRAVEAKMKLTGLKQDDPRLQEELLEIKGNLEHEMRLGEATYVECWRGLNLRRTLLGVFMQVWQQRISPTSHDR